MIIDIRTALYAYSVVAALSAGRQLSGMTDICPECEQEIRYDNHGDHIAYDATPDDADDGVVNIVVIVACEGYWVIDPNEVGIVSEAWQSHADELAALEAELDVSAHTDANVADHPSTDPEESARIDTIPTTWGPWGKDGRPGV